MQLRHRRQWHVIQTQFDKATFQAEKCSIHDFQLFVVGQIQWRKTRQRGEGGIIQAEEEIIR